jgi:hypothetical protein
MGEHRRTIRLTVTALTAIGEPSRCSYACAWMADDGDGLRCVLFREALWMPEGSPVRHEECIRAEGGGDG